MLKNRGSDYGEEGCKNTLGTLPGWVDSTPIGIHRHGSGALKKNGPQAIGRGRKGVDTKIHVALSPTKIQGACVSASNILDMKEFSVLWSQCDWR